MIEWLRMKARNFVANNPQAREFLAGDPLDPRYYEGGGQMNGTKSGKDVTLDNALNYSAVWAASRVISETVARLPIPLYRRLPNGGRERATNHPLYRLLGEQPNYESASMPWRECMTERTVNAGNGIAEKEMDGLGRVVNLWPIHPSRVELKRNKRSELIYLISNNDGSQTPLRKYEVLHIVGALPKDGVWGRGTIAAARESIGQAQATDEYGGAFFGNGAKPSGVLKHPKTLPDAARNNLRKEWNSLHQGSNNAGNVAILWEGMDYMPISISNEDSQFLQTREFNVTEIARWYCLPPHKLGDLSRATFSNIEQQSIDFVVHSIGPWLRRCESAYNQLLSEEERGIYFFEHVVEDLLKGDIVSRYSAYQIALQNGWMNRDEIRQRENLNSIPDGDAFFILGNLASADAILNPPEPEPIEPPTRPMDNSLAFERAAREMLADAVGRMLSKEANAANRAAGDANKFLTWMDEFYEHHAKLCDKAFAAPLAALSAVGRNDMANFTSLHIEYSKGVLLAACECQPDELQAKVKEATEFWTKRADDIRGLEHAEN